MASTELLNRPLDDDLALLLRGRRLGPTGEGRAIRLRARLSITEMAALLNVSEVVYRNWDAGRYRPRRADAIRWARLVGQIEAGLAELGDESTTA